MTNIHLFMLMPGNDSFLSFFSVRLFLHVNSHLTGDQKKRTINVSHRNYQLLMKVDSATGYLLFIQSSNR